MTKATKPGPGTLWVKDASDWGVSRGFGTRIPLKWLTGSGPPKENNWGRWAPTPGCAKAGTILQES